MSMQDKIHINTHYTRSINLERDSSSLNVVKAYIPTSRSLKTMQRVVDSFGAKQVPRSWSLIGPYGSGKSSFSVFLSHLLSQKDNDTTLAAYEVLSKSDKELSNKFKSYKKNTNGHLKVLLTGAPEPLSLRFVRALSTATDEYFLQLDTTNSQQKILERLSQVANKDIVYNSEILEILTELKDCLKGIAAGIIIIVDELGKFLEYEARHNDANDIYLLQQLSVFAESDHEINIMIFVMLHQSFDQYAKGLGESLKQEWSKIQGRFEDIPFLESSEAILRVVSSAFKQTLEENEQDKLTKTVQKIVTILIDQKALPSVLEYDNAVDLFKKCYPLHPITALILPILCQKVAQNERTLFSYLGSQESFGLNKLLEEFNTIDEMIYPHHVYDYFITNQPAVLSDHMTHRRWAEVVTAVERLGDASPEYVEFLKTIGLFNIIGVKGGIKASKELLATLFGKKENVINMADFLAKKSIIQFRKYSSEYRVWQGSDFDLEGAIETELSKLGTFSLSNTLNERNEILPIVARKYTIENGALRYFQPVFVDTNNYRKIGEKSDNPRIIYYLSGAQAEDKILFENKVTSYYSELDIVAFCQNVPRFREVTSEIVALEYIQHSERALHSDPVAQREFKDRLNTAKYYENELLRELNDKPQEQLWYWKEKKLEIQSKRQLQEQFSTILEAVYSNAPIILNELINKDKPSAQANAAKNKLAIAMLHNENYKDLNIDKFPPEKSIYRSLFKKTKLHQEVNGEWMFIYLNSKEKESDPNNFYPVFQEIDKFLDSTEEKSKSFVELNKKLISPPYGIKVGVLTLLYMSVLCSQKNKLAIYEDDIYCPELVEEQIARFLKRPDTFSVQRFRLEGVNKLLYKSYAKTLYKDYKERSLLDLARPIVQFVLDLPLYVQKTSIDLSPEAISLRDEVRLAKSPISLMLENIPKALGIDLEKADTNKEEVSKLSIRLTGTIKELKYCLDTLKLKLKESLAKSFGFDNNIELSKLKTFIAERCNGLEDYKVNDNGLKLFIQRAQNTKLDDDVWLEEILNFLGKKPIEKWTDADSETVYYRISEYASKLNELLSLREYNNNQENSNENFDVYLLRSVKNGSRSHDEIVVIDKEKHNDIEVTKKGIEEQLSTLGDDLKFALLAEILNGSLEKRSELMSKKKSSQKIYGNKKVVNYD